MTLTIDHPAPRVPENDGTRREFLAGALATAVLVGCGEDQRASDGPTTRLVTDSKGRRVRIPTASRRVVSLDFGPSTASLINLGITPVGATTNIGFDPLLGPSAKRIANLGGTDSVKVERIAELRPDLIVLNAVYIDLDPEQLQRIAPTVAFETPNRFSDILRIQAGFVGRSERADELVREFEDELRGSEARKQIAGRKVALTSVRDGQFSLFGPRLQFGILIEALSGTIVPERVGKKALTDARDDLSIEVLPDLLDEADFVVLLRDFGSAEADADVRRTLASPLWRRVPAVQRDNVRVVDIQAMVGSYGFAGLRRVLDQLATAPPAS